MISGILTIWDNAEQKLQQLPPARHRSVRLTNNTNNVPHPHCLVESPKREPFGAGDETRTRDINLGKVALYQLSYTRARKGKLL